MKKDGRRPSLGAAAMIVALVALTVAVAGPAIGAVLSKANKSNTCSLKNVKGNQRVQVSSKCVKNGSIDTNDLAGNAVDTAKIASGAVTSSKLQSGFQARAFALVQADGTLVAGNSRGITQANVTGPIGGSVYCFNGLGFTPKAGVATVRWLAGGNVDARTAVQPDDSGSCPGAENASVRTTDSGTGGGTTGPFYVVLYD